MKLASFLNNKLKMITSIINKKYIMILLVVLLLLGLYYLNIFNTNTNKSESSNETMKTIKK